MDIDLLPFNAFALDSAVAPPAIQAESCTLTLRPSLAAEGPAVDLAATLAALPMLSGEPLHASVVSCDSPALTITF